MTKWRKKRRSLSVSMHLPQLFEPVGEPRLHRAEGDLQHVRDLVERQLFVVVEDDDGLARRGEAGHEAGELAHLVARHRRRRGELLVELLERRRVAAAAERAKGFAAGDAEGPRAEVA